MLPLCLPLLLAPSSGQDSTTPAPPVRELTVQLDLEDGTDLKAFGRALAAALDRPVKVDEGIADACAEDDFNFGMTLPRAVQVSDLLDAIETRAEGDLWCLEDGDGLRLAHRRALPPELRRTWTLALDETPIFDDLESLRETVEIASGSWFWSMRGAELVVDGDRIVARHWDPVIRGLEMLSDALTRPYDEVEELAEQRFDPPLLGDAERRTRDLLDVDRDVTLGKAGTDVRDAFAALEDATGLVVLFDTNVKDNVDEEELELRQSHGPRPPREALRALQAQLPGAAVTPLGGLVSVATSGPLYGRHRTGRYDLRGLLAASDDTKIAPAWIEEYIVTEVFPDSWDMDPSCSIRVTEGGQLWMNHSQRAHEDLCVLLHQLVAEDDPWKVIEETVGN